MQSFSIKSAQTNPSGLAPSDALVWGATGHAKVLRPILRQSGFHIVALIDRDERVAPTFYGAPVFRSLEELFARDIRLPPTFSIAIGGSRGIDRMDIQSRLVGCGSTPITLVHSTAWIPESAILQEGCQILAMAALSEDVHIGRQTIVNTNATVDHETNIGDGCHVMPGATVAGCVKIGNLSTIGSNATILPRLTIGHRVIIGAGSVVTRDIPDDVVAYGVPARIQRYSSGSA